MEPVTDTAGLDDLLARATKIVDTTFSGLDWPERMENGSFTDCRFLSCRFRDVHLTECAFRDCIFDQCSFDSARLTDCLFLKCRFFSSEEESGCSFRFASFPGTCFENCDLSLCNFSRSSLYRIELLGCQASGMDLSHSTTAQSLGASLTVSSARMMNCNFSYADFTGAWLCESEMPDNRFSHAIFHEANLENARLNDCDFHGIEAKAITLAGADLRGASIGGLDIREIDTTGIRIEEWQQRALLERLGILID